MIKWLGNTQGLFKGFFPAVLSTVSNSIGGLFMVVPITRNFIAKNFLPGKCYYLKNESAGCLNRLSEVAQRSLVAETACARERRTVNQ